MCDYSLEFYRSVPAETGAQYTLERFLSGSMGFTAGVSAGRSCDTAVCMPEGAKLLLANIAEPVRQSFGIGAAEEAVMVRLAIGPHRDGVRFANGREVSLQALNSGVTAAVMSQPADVAEISTPISAVTEETSPTGELAHA